MPSAAGAGLSARLRGTDQVCLCFFGDGAANCGPFHESLNIAAVWKLPVVFLCENNGYGIHTPTEQVSAVVDVARRAEAYAMPGVIVDGQNVLAVHEAVQTAVCRARAGDGPTLVEAKTYRYCEHWESNTPAPKYRSEDEVAEWRRRDPIEMLVARLSAVGKLTEAERVVLTAQVEAEVDAAVTFAETSLLPEPQALFEDIYA
jgi:acetoin:2,6-dichlorophenolindophenol oxidoreductase subunit alpha